VQRKESEHLRALACKADSPAHAPIGVYHTPGNTKGGIITVLLISCLTGLESAV